MEWFIKRLDQTNPTFDYNDLYAHVDDFKRLLDLKILKYTDEVVGLPCEWCDEPHSVTPFINARGEFVLSCFGNSRIVLPEELKIRTINRDALIENVHSKNAVVNKALFERTVFALSNHIYAIQYGAVEEPIRTIVGIEICGKTAQKGRDYFSLNKTDRQIVYFLYDTFLKNRAECFRGEKIAQRIAYEGKKKSERYILNRIGIINTEIKNLIGRGRATVGDFRAKETFGVLKML